MLRGWLKENVDKARTNSSTRILITGYSDCVGPENNNGACVAAAPMRMARLLQQLAGPGARYLSGSVKTAAAPPGSYLADNSTVQGRAQNRGVRIETKSVVTFAEEPVTARFPAPNPGVEEPEFIRRVVERGRALFGRSGKWTSSACRSTSSGDGKTFCVCSTRSHSPAADVRYLTAAAVERYDRDLGIPEPELRDAIEYPDPGQAAPRAWTLARPHRAGEGRTGKSGAP